MQSDPPLATSLPSGENATALTGPSCPSHRTSDRSGCRTTSPPRPATATRFTPGLNAIPAIGPIRTSSAALGVTVPKSHCRTVPSEPADSSRSPLRENATDGHPWSRWLDAGTGGSDRPEWMPGAQSRWNAGKDLSWELLRPERVVEVRYDHMEGRRFRHTAHVARWRPDRDPRSCTYAQLEEPVRYDLSEVLR